jgi:hypothetical protein
LTHQKKAYLIKNLEIRNVKPTIENLSKYLYDVRSRFVHEAQLIVNMSGKTTIGKYGKRSVICRLSLKKLMEFFEEGLINYFEKHNNRMHPIGQEAASG